MSRQHTERDLAAPVVEYWRSLGYTVRAEVKHCDLVAVRGDELIAVELKLTIGLKLLVQAARRQQAADFVYVAVTRPLRGLHSGSFRGVLHLLRRLELGLILVDLRSNPPAVEVALQPNSQAGRRKSKARREMVDEVSRRSVDLNTAGSTRRELMTAYREHALRLAHELSLAGPLTARQLRERGAGPKTYATLYRNVYGWFARQGRGLYALSPAGQEALVKHAALTAQWGCIDAPKSADAPLEQVRRT